LKQPSEQILKLQNRS